MLSVNEYCYTTSPGPGYHQHLDFLQVWGNAGYGNLSVAVN
jgi:hypothetical protein